MFYLAIYEIHMRALFSKHIKIMQLFISKMNFIKLTVHTRIIIKKIIVNFRRKC